MSDPIDADSRRSVYTILLSAPPSCIEFSPRMNNVFIVGTYNLSEQEHPDDQLTTTSLEHGDNDTQFRTGSLLLFHRDTDDNVHLVNSYITTSAILDLHFSPHHQDILATANSTGGLNFYKLSLEGDSLNTIIAIQAFDRATLVLSLAWNHDSQFENELAVTLSTGRVAIVNYQAELGTAATVVDTLPNRSFQAHSLEAWTVSWSSRPGYLLSGGDDSVIRRWNAHDRRDKLIEIATEKLPVDKEFEKHLRQAPPLISTPGTITDTRTHAAGVTAILPLFLREKDLQDIVLTGSYDEVIRVLAPNNGRMWQSLAELRLDGGVWRLKHLRSVTSEIGFEVIVLASCMHAGPRIVQVTERKGIWDVKCTAKFSEHQSMNYASDAMLVSGQEQYTIISTSFYDRRLCVWKWP